MPIPESVQAFLDLMGFEYSTVHGSADDDPARVDTYLFTCRHHTPILAVTPHGRAVDARTLGRLSGTRWQHGEPATVPPLGPVYGQQVYVDWDVAQQPWIVFTSGAPHELVRMRYRDFAELVHPLVGRFQRP